MTKDDFMARVGLLGSNYTVNEVGKNVYELIDTNIGVHNLLRFRESIGKIQKYPMDFSSVTVFPELKAIRVGVDNKEGLVDYLLDDLVKPVYDKIYVVNRQFFELYDSTVINLLDSKMNQLIPITYNSVDIYTGDRTLIVCTKSDMVSVYEYTKWEAHIILSKRDNIVSKPRLIDGKYLGYYSNQDSISGHNFDRILDLKNGANVTDRFTMVADSNKKRLVDIEANRRCCILKPAELE